jgi:hypothetical protein
MQPIILAGRSGEQYADTLRETVAEMYNIANITDPFSGAGDKEPKGDPYTMLFAAMRDKQKFSMYAEKFEEFLVEIARVALSLVKAYYEEGRLVPIVGKNEYVNLEELKNSDDIKYQIKLEPQVDDVETKMGRHLAFNHILQYTGNNLQREDLGKLIRHMPYANVEGMLEDVTMDYDNATSDILALDRGKMREARPTDNHQYMVSRLTHRMKRPDFDMLPPQIQQMYQMRTGQHEQAIAQQAAEAQRAEAGFIPSGGYGVRLDFYVDDGKGGTKRATLPYESVDWLIKQLETQGSTQEMLTSLPPSSLGNVVNMMGAPQGGTPQGLVAPGAAQTLPLG